MPVSKTRTVIPRSDYPLVYDNKTREWKVQRILIAPFCESGRKEWTRKMQARRSGGY